jgi:hypothetical protein
MKKSELIELIREVIKKEMQSTIKKQVDFAVRKHLNEIFINKGKEALFNTPLDPTSPPTMTEAIGYEMPEPPRNPKSYVSDPTLNSILNNTRGGIPQGDVPGVGTMPETITEALRKQYGGNIDDQTRLEIGAVQTIKNQGVSVKDVPPDVLKNLTRNYRDVLNKSKQITDRKQGKY